MQAMAPLMFSSNALALSGKAFVLLVMASLAGSNIIDQSALDLFLPARSATILTGHTQLKNKFTLIGAIIICAVLVINNASVTTNVLSIELNRKGKKRNNRHI